MFYTSFIKGWRALVFIFLSHSLMAQVREPFDQMDLSPVTSNFFYPQTFKHVAVPDPLSSSCFDRPLTSVQSASLVAGFDKACIQSELYINEFSDFRVQLNSTGRAKDAIPISIMDITYHDFVLNALADHLIEFVDGKFLDVPGRTQSPFEEKDAFVFWVDASYYKNEIMHFVLEESFYVTNRNSLPSQIEIDFDDGLGYRAIEFGEIVTVDYSNSQTDRSLKCKVTRAGSQSFYGAAKMKLTVEFHPCDVTNFPFPNEAPWPTETGWKVSSNFGSTQVNCNAYTLTSDDGVFDKPFIFVEGIDFGLDNNNQYIFEEYRNGTFGWCEFSSGFLDPNPQDDYDYGYDDLHLMPTLLNEIRSYGYDIVLVDFYDGALDMDKNSEVVQQVIRLCNDYKVGDESLVIAGASMGGVVTRHALRKMELNNEDHCTRLWISFDAPHSGANIPIGMQQAIHFYAVNGNEDAAILRDLYLMRPAARQLLKIQAFSDLTMFNNWQSHIGAMGYPQECRRLSISNGRKDGMGLDYSFQRVMDWECEVGVTTLARNYLYHNAGDPVNLMNEPGQNVLGMFRTTIVGLDAIGNEWYYGFINPTWAVLDVVDFEDLTVYTPTGQKNWDYGPGGKRNSIRTLAISINDELSDLGLEGICDGVSTNDYNIDHAFVPSVSAVGLSTGDPYVDIPAYLYQHPEENHFDRMEFAESANENHVELTTQNINFVLEEVLCFEYAGLGDELTQSSSNSGVFNYGRPSFNTLHDIHIHNGGSLKVNSNLPTHFNGALDYESNKIYFKVNTIECTPAEILIDDNGSLEIGDILGYAKTGEIELNRDSKIILGENGTLRIFPGSSLVINEGAELVVRELSNLEVWNGGAITCKAGGRITIEGDNIQNTETQVLLIGQDSRITFEGGCLYINEFATLSIAGQNGATGYIEILPGSENTLHTGENSALRITGQDQGNVILKINNYAHLQNADWHKGRIHLNTGRVELLNHGAIYTDMYFEALNVNFFSGNSSFDIGGEVWVFSNGSHVEKCLFNQVELHGYSAKNLVSTTSFIGTKSGMKIFSGGYWVYNSIFQNEGIHSEALQMASSVRACSFSDGYDAQIWDKSLVELDVRNSQFSSATEYAAYKTGGVLTLACNEFTEVHGVKMQDGTLNMSGESRAGHNKFLYCEPCITLANAQDILLEDGYNDLSGYFNNCIVGTLNQPCGFKYLCENHIGAQHNFWGLGLDQYGEPSETTISGPVLEDIHVYTSVISDCGGYENSNACEVLFFDNEPQWQTDCPARPRPHVKSASSNTVDAGKEKVKHSLVGEAKSNDGEVTNPLITTSQFNGIPLDSALILAAMNLTAYDTLANDAEGIALFHEILMSGLDKENVDIRTKMNWARVHMKNAVENLFMTGELLPENNLVSFETPVQQYVDVLNLMTSTHLADSTYKAQFYLELDKGQLFRTLNKRNIAQQIFLHLDDCQLDSLEQSVLNSWRAQVDLEASLNNQVFLQNIDPDSFNYSIDTTHYVTPFPITESDLYFGLWIDSPLSVTFVSCSSHPVYRSLFHETGQFGIYPNPSNNQINLSGLFSDTDYEISLMDLSGRLISTHKIIGNTNGNCALEFEKSLASGTYLIRIAGPEMTEDHLHVISK